MAGIINEKEELEQAIMLRFWLKREKEAAENLMACYTSAVWS